MPLRRIIFDTNAKENCDVTSCGPEIGFIGINRISKVDVKPKYFKIIHGRAAILNYTIITKR